MGILARLHAVDDRVLGRPISRELWDRGLRLWWLAPVLAGFFLAVLTALQFAGANPPVAAFGALLFPLFQSGYFYNERMRQLGREPRWARRPPGI